MSTLQWSDALVLGMPTMDTTHQEFVALLAAADQADDANLVPAWQTLTKHTENHFEREDRWMLDTAFAAAHCHMMQHQMILQVMGEGARRARSGDLALLRVLCAEVASWFVQHAQSMDAALAGHLRDLQYDEATGTVHQPQGACASRAGGCGAGCATPPAVPEPTAAELAH